MLPNIERHLEWMKLRNLSETTITGRRQLLLGVATWLGCQPGGHATPEGLAAWQRTLGVGPYCMAKYVSHLRSYFEWQQREGIRDDNPAVRLVVPKLGRRLPRPIATPDLLRAVDQAPARIRPWLVLAAWGGFRCVEIAYLRRESVRETAAEPHIIVTAQATKGRNERVVPMSATLRAELLPVLPRRGWVFPRLDDRPGPIKPNRVSQMGSEYLHGLGLAETMHSLRHWFGTQAYEGTHDIRAVQELLGHSSLRTTELYTKISDGKRLAAVQAIPPLNSSSGAILSKIDCGAR